MHCVEFVGFFNHLSTSFSPSFILIWPSYICSPCQSFSLVILHTVPEWVLQCMSVCVCVLREREWERGEKESLTLPTAASCHNCQVMMKHCCDRRQYSRYGGEKERNFSASPSPISPSSTFLPSLSTYLYLLGTFIQIVLSLLGILHQLGVPALLQLLLVLQVGHFLWLFFHLPAHTKTETNTKQLIPNHVTS